MASITSAATPDGRFTYLSAGAPEPTAPTIVFLHGIGGGARLWTRQLARFGDSFRAIAWNMPGYGGSVPLATTSIGLLGEALASFVVGLGIERPVLVGHSIGGMIVQSLLADGLAPARAVVLAQTSPVFGGRDPSWARDFVAARLGPLDRGARMAEIAAGNVDGMLGDDPDPAGVALAREVMADTPEAAYRDSTLSMIGFDRREALVRIGVPTLLVSGSRDANAPAATMAKMAEKIASSEHVCVEGAGHLVMLERPDAFDAALAGFLSRHGIGAFA